MNKEPIKSINKHGQWFIAKTNDGYRGVLLHSRSKRLQDYLFQIDHAEYLAMIIEAQKKTSNRVFSVIVGGWVALLAIVAIISEILK